MAEANWVYSPSGIGYNWRFQPEAYQERFARNANQIAGRLITKWDDAGQLKADLMESAERVAGQSWLKRITPLVCPESDFLYLTDMLKVESFPPKADATGYGTQTRDDETGWWSHDRIGYQCTFTNLPYLVKEDDEVKSLTNPELDRYTTIMPQSVTTNRTVTGTRFVLEDTPALGVNETAARPETLVRFLVKQWMWPKAAVPWTTIFDRANKLNNASFVLHGITHAAETLAYEGLAGTPEEYTGPDGAKYVDLTHIVTRHPVNWNKTLWAEPPGGLVWKYIKLADPPTGTPFTSPQRRFLTASFAEIFNPI